MPKDYEGRKIDNISKLISSFKEKNMKHFVRKINFGQPFYTKEDAKKFINHYAEEISEVLVDNYIETQLITLESNPQGYNYFLSNEKEIGIFIIEK